MTLMLRGGGSADSARAGDVPRSGELAAARKGGFDGVLDAACVVGAACLVAIVGITPAHGQTYQTWRGENTQNSWQNSSAWWNFGVNSPIVFGQQEWDNNVELAQTNNNGGNTFSTWRWVYKAGATQAHTFSGDPVQFFDFGGQAPLIQNESSATHAIDMNIAGDTSGDPLSININGSGGLTFGGAVDNQGSTINVGGTTASAATVRFNGVVSGNAGMYVNNGNLTVLFDATNTMSGQLTINAGIVQLNAAGDTFGGSSQAIRIGTGAILDLNDVSTSVGSVAEEGNLDGGTIDLGSATLTVTGADTGSLFQGNITGTGGLTMAGSGTTALSLYGTQSYSGTTTVSGGRLSTGVALASAGFSLSGGVFETTSGNVVADTAAITLSGGSLELGGSETFGNNGVTLSSGTSTISPGTGITAAIGGALTGSGNLVKAGPGTLKLNATASSFSGTTAVNAGTLVANAASALGSGAVTIASGATLQLDNLVANSITNNGGTLSFAGGGIQRTSTQATGTVATLAAGTGGQAGSPTALSPTIAWQARPQDTYSDVLDLTGTNGTVQILQLSYDPALLGGVSESDLQLGWDDAGTWVNAVNGNSATGTSAVANGSGSYVSLGILATADYLGSWGRDTAANVVWAVVDHNSDFVVIAVPEPGVGLTAAAGMIAYGLVLRRASRSGRLAGHA